MNRQMNGVGYSHTRRAFLRTSTMGLGAMALSSLLNEGSAQDANPLRPRPGHFPAKAKSVIFLFMAGGPSHLELFDPKPTLQRLDGQTVPDSFTAPRRRLSPSFGPTPNCSARAGASARPARSGPTSAKCCPTIATSSMTFACSRG